MLALFACTKFAGMFADDIWKGRGLVILDADYWFEAAGNNKRLINLRPSNAGCPFN
jgi:hypothetical protein